MFVIGGIGDQIAHLVWPRLLGLDSLTLQTLLNYAPYRYSFASYLDPLSTSQPILWLILKLGDYAFGYNFYHALSVFIVFFTLPVCVKVLKEFKYKVILSLLFSFSSFYFIHLGVHIELVQLWLIPIFVIGFIQRVETGKLWPFGILLAVATGVSNYLGFVLLVFASSYIIANLCKKLILRGETPNFSLGIRTVLPQAKEDTLAFRPEGFIYRKGFKDFFLSIIKFGLVGFISLLSIFGYYIYKNYYQNVSQKDIIYYTSTDSTHKSYGNFFSFSSRPWYFLIPSTRNPILGGIATAIYNKIKSTNYFLADDYFPKEHAGNYFGLLFLTTTTFFTIRTLVSRHAKSSLKKKILLLWGTVAIMISFAMPPFFTISGVKIYTPGEIIYRTLPMFRTTTRISVVILFCLLIILGLTSNFVVSTAKRKWLVTAYMIALLVVTLAETYNTVRIKRYLYPPNVYAYLQRLPDTKVLFAVYPYSKTEEAFFWMPTHKKLILNHKGYTPFSFNPETLTARFTTTAGLEETKKLGASYIIVYKDSTANELNFFSNSPLLSLEKTFEDTFLYKLN